MKPISEYNFKEVIGHFVKIQTPDHIKKVVGDKEFILTYCYVDTQAGISFQVIDDENNLIILRYDEKYLIDPVEISEVSAENIKKGTEIEDVHTNDITKTQWAIRYLDIFDPYRDDRFPDDILIPSYVNPPSQETKSIWMKPIDIYDEDKLIIAEALESVDNISTGDHLCILPTEDGFVAMNFELYKHIIKGEKNV